MLEGDEELGEEKAPGWFQSVCRRWERHPVVTQLTVFRLPEWHRWANHLVQNELFVGSKERFNKQW
jgi:hypothetical protein